MARLDLDASVVVDALDAALVVVSDAGDILDYNDAFADIVADAPTTGQAETTLEHYPTLQARLERREAGIVPIDTDTGKRYYHLKPSEIETEAAAGATLVVLHDVTEQQRQCQELERQNEQLDKFASLITHDLRNPLDVAIGRTNAVAELVDDPEITAQIEEIQASHSRMVRIIQDVLTLAREGQSIDSKSDVCLAATAERAWNHVETDGAQLDVTTEQNVQADEERLAQVFENLFRNAVEHSSASESAVLTVTVGALEDAAGFYVADDGPGIRQDVRERVFEAGFSDEDGTGLGLAIVSNIAEAHGWDVAVTESEDGGARFEFTGVEPADSA
ncbi:sensor histidine kinase [Salinibaculum rarum]|uniref:sensor histidine kinase n=1 Tax=Salinibaculum rarum TaxID=3058903 RepID=UPI00265E1012|nr:HAMP domain-containing sensor histidine kinase [Salinibaculum sp. KK48]